MMKSLLLALLFAGSLFSASLYTLDNVHSLNIYFASDANFLTEEKKDELKSMLTKKLEKAGFVFGETDADIFVVKVSALEIEDSLALHLEVGLGEEVITKRKGNIETFSYTYLESKFIEGFDPYEDTREALNTLVDAFINAHKDDNEE
jgi:hypothetical protein